ncbi:SusC/RagA family TonB-linked outer membrane protein [Arundinibacter roseus]|uniref:SusC/RagA family TonB-linked outer membrane protein n=1 Tax=Arundinibacter roseus TaxID=2070510 RepID=A0A4R4K3Q7_9BACT|nr:SusC/RagA family TonB-linked outer membrane protein [Arundinibacter roseus]TDB61863.1 SusC/RagA family TonB-linked outer membrane protein [Arundinibacter roseus]
MKRILHFKHLFLLLLVTGISLTGWAQNSRVSGTVTSSKENQPLPGVSILVKGTNVGTTTDADGKFALNAEPNATLVFSFIGYATQEINVENKSVLTVSLVEGATSLEEVVVTALGIKKESKKLGYATTTVGAEQITVNRTPNFINTLQGKIAGVNITSLGTGPGGSSKIRIRGQSSFSGQNSPLIVVNGVPIDNTNFGTNPGNQSSDNSVGSRGGGNTSDGGDGLSSINPDDIESMTVLKGATAAALYGSRAKDGVIMVTTKTRGEGRGIGVTYNSNFTVDTPLDFTDYQYEYGQGEFGLRPTSPNPTSGQWSFGEKFQPGMTQVLFDGVTVPYEPVYDRIRTFFRNGINFNNTVSLSSASEKGGFNLSLANMDNKGIVPNNSFNRKTINLGFSYDLSKKLSVSGNINYSNEVNKNPPVIAEQDNSIPTSIYNMANSMPFDLLDEKKYDANGNEFVYSRFRNRTNPYFTLAEQFQNVTRDRIFGNIAIRYNLLPWMYVQARVGQDYWSRDQDYNNFPTGQASRPAAPEGFVNGLYTQESRRFRELNKDILIGATQKFGDFGFDLTLGGNQMYRRSDLNSVQVTDFIVRDLYTVMNSRVKDPLYALSERAVNSVYGAAEVSYKEFLFLNVTARNDWFSTLSPANRSILYPSISGSFVFSQAFNNLPNWLNFGKLRAAYAEVGSDTDVSPYANNLFYGVNANLFPNVSNALQPVGFISGNTVPNANLRPMRSTESEVGLELKLFDNRVGIDFALYRKITEDQIVSAQISDASGYVNTLINSGRGRNQGVELLVNLGMVRGNDFQWDVSLNGSYNQTKVLSLLTDTPGERITVGTHVFNGELRQVVGQPMAQLYGFGYRRDDQGRKIFGGNGIPLRTTDLISFGSAIPKWVGGITNNFNYKGINLSFLIDFKLGHNMMSGTNFNATRHGLHKMTLEGREGGVIGEGVNERGEPNTVVAGVQPYWEVVRSLALVEPIVYDAGFWKLRQITAGYDFSRFLPAAFPVKGVRLSFVANNVLLLKKWVPNIDPESFGYGSDNVVGLEATGLPTTRSMGFNLNVKF